MKKIKSEKCIPDNNQTQRKLPPLSRAVEIEERLKSCKRFTPKDRVILSQNLGNLVDAEIRKTPNLNIRKLYQQAFGDNFDSTYKKRTNLITLPKETPRNKLKASSREYLAIIEAISKIQKQNSTQSITELKRKLILRLVEYSSFDDQRMMKDRIDEEQHSHLRGVFAKLITRITDEIDLDHQLVWYESYNSSVGLHCNNMKANVSAPTIKIADVMYRCEVTETAKVSFTKDEICNAEKIGSDGIEQWLRQRISKDLCKTLYDEPYLGKDGIEKDIDGFLEYEVIDEQKERSLYQLFPKLEFTPTISSFYVRSSIFLQIRYDDYWNRWIPVIVWTQADDLISPFDSQNLVDDWNDRYYKDDDWSQMYSDNHLAEWNKTYHIAPIWEDYNYLRAAKPQHHISSLDSNNITYEFFLGDYLKECKHLGSINFRGFEFFNSALSGSPLVTDEKFYEGLLRSPHENEKIYEVIPRLKQGSGKWGNTKKFTIAPEGSIAEIILKNLAYADVEDRIDNLLLKDARQKNKLFKKLEETSKKEYLSALKKFENNK